MVCRAGRPQARRLARRLPRRSARRLETLKLDFPSIEGEALEELKAAEQAFCWRKSAEQDRKSDAPARIASMRPPSRRLRLHTSYGSDYNSGCRNDGIWQESASLEETTSGICNCRGADRNVRRFSRCRRAVGFRRRVASRRQGSAPPGNRKRSALEAGDRAADSASDRRGKGRPAFPGASATACRTACRAGC